MKKNWEIPFCYIQNGEGFSNFFFGIFLYEVLNKFSIQGRKKMLYFKAGFAVFGGILIAVSFKYGLSKFPGDFRFLIIFGLCPAVILGAVYFKVIGKALMFSPIHKLGKISMEIYFLHVPAANTYLVLRKKIGWVQAADMRIQFCIYLVLLIMFSAAIRKMCEAAGIKN